MKYIIRSAVFCAGSALLLLSCSVSNALAQGTAFTYQGRLVDSGGPANGIYDLRFTIYDALANGNAVAGPLTNSVTTFNNGLFTVTLDFGSGVFTGNPLWMEIGVRTNGGGGFGTLNPRQQLTATPYAVLAGNVSGVVSNNALAGAYSGALNFNNHSNQ